MATGLCPTSVLELVVVLLVLHGEMSLTAQRPQSQQPRGRGRAGGQARGGQAGRVSGQRDRGAVSRVGQVLLLEHNKTHTVRRV